MKSFRRIALLGALAVAAVQPATLLVPGALSAAPISTIKTKKRKKHKKQKEVVLKGHRGRRARKPA
jgi:hypothetical protein